MQRITMAIAAALLAACNAQNVENSPQTNAPQPIEVVQPAPQPANPESSLPEPKGPIDPKSIEAAGQVVQHYGALIEQGRWAEAAALWGDPQSARKFETDLKPNRENHLEIGELGEPEGAAGSIYITMPVTLYGQDADGKEFRAHRTVILRRVNDVPGSTEAQRRWHIEGFETGWENRA